MTGFRLRSDIKIVRWPDRCMDGRGREFWDRVMGLLPTGSNADLAAELGSVAEPADLAESMSHTYGDFCSLEGRAEAPGLKFGEFRVVGQVGLRNRSAALA